MKNELEPEVNIIGMLTRSRKGMKKLLKFLSTTPSSKIDDKLTLR